MSAPTISGLFVEFKYYKLSPLHIIGCFTVFPFFKIMVSYITHAALKNITVGQCTINVPPNLLHEQPNWILKGPGWIFLKKISNDQLKMYLKGHSDLLMCSHYVLQEDLQISFH